MKQFIVMMATIALGVVLYQLIAGEGPDSMVSALSEVWKQEIQSRTLSP